MSGCGIWEELKLYHTDGFSCVTFDIVAIDIPPVEHYMADEIYYLVG